MTTKELTSLHRGDIDSGFFLDAKRAGSVALDIETTGLDPKTERVATIQAALPSNRLSLVQVEVGVVPEKLLTLLEMPTVRKVFHHAPFDLRFMVNTWRTRPDNIVCTKVLSKIVEPDCGNHSLQELVRNRLGIEISKSAVRTSDWTQTVLTEDQLEYALNDVRYLHPLFESLMAEAIDKGLAGVAEASFAYLPTRTITDLRGSGDIFAY